MTVLNTVWKIAIMEKSRVKSQMRKMSNYFVHGERKNSGAGSQAEYYKQVMYLKVMQMG